MKKKILTIISILLIICSLTLCIKFYVDNNASHKVTKTTKVVKVKKDDDKVDITKLQNEYNNSDIIAYIEIPNVLSTPVVQTSDNDYYLSHDLRKNYDIKGSVYLDYRNKLNDKKILLYGHSGKEQELPFLQLNKYIDESFYKEHKYIYLHTKEEKRKYLIFSSYIETEDYDYVNLNSFNGLSWTEHLNKLKNKSNYKVDVNIDDNSKIIILQTCSMNNERIGNFHLVIGLEIR